MSLSTQVQPYPPVQTSNSQTAGWTEDRVKQWLIEKNLNDITKQ